MATKLDKQHEERNLWAHAVRGLFGIIRILEHFAFGHAWGCPSGDLLRASQRLKDLAAKADERNLTDPEQPTYDKPITN